MGITMENRYHILSSRILSLLEKYKMEVRAGASEDSADSILDEIEEIAPNSEFNDLMFFGERERTYDEIAREVAERERIAEEDGIRKLLLRFVHQADIVLVDGGSDELSLDLAKKMKDKAVAKLNLLNYRTRA